MNSHNFLIHNINKKIAKSIDYDGEVIDLGCGIAPYKDYVLRSADSYVGVDWPTSFHRNSNVDVYANLVKGLPFSSGSFDTAISFQVMEHLPEPQLFLNEAFRVLKPGGKIIITVPFMWHVHEAPYDYYRYTYYGLQYLFNHAGFMNIEIKENTGFWQMWILKFNYYTAQHTPFLLKFLWIPIWWLGQEVSPRLDSLNNHTGETASYTVIAQKPWST